MPLAFDGTFDLLDDELVTIPPGMVLQRLIRVNNAITMLMQQRIDVRNRMKGVDRKDPQYPDLNVERYKIDDEIDVLKKKFDTLNQILFMKTAEMRMAGKTYA